MGTLFENIEWLLLILPSCGTLCYGRRLGTYVGVVGALLVSLPLLVGESVAPGLVGHPSSLTWVRVWDGDRFIDGALVPRIDALSIFTVLIVLTTAFFLLRYFDDASPHELFWLGCYLTALLLLALADNFVMLLLGWSLAGWLPMVVDRASGSARRWMAILFGDASLLMAVGLTAWHVGSLSVGRLTSMWPLPSDMALATSLMVIAAISRAAWVPFIFRAGPMSGTVIRALGGLLPAIFLVGRAYHLVMAFSFSRFLLCAWGLAFSLSLSVVALTVGDGDRQATLIHAAQAGLMLTAIGLGGWAATFSMSIPVTLTGALLYCGSFEERSRRWWTGVGFVAMSGLPLTPAFAFNGGLLRAAWRVGWPATIGAVLGMVAVAAVAGQAIKRTTDRAGKGDGRGGSALSAMTLLIALVGILNLAAPPPAARFLSPVFGAVTEVISGGYYTLAAAAAVVGVVAGYTLSIPPALTMVGNWLADLFDVDGRAFTVIINALRALGRQLLAVEGWLGVRCATTWSR